MFWSCYLFFAKVKVLCAKQFSCDWISQMLSLKIVIKYKNLFCQKPKYIPVPKKAASILFQHGITFLLIAVHWSYCYDTSFCFIMQVLSYSIHQQLLVTVYNTREPNIVGRECHLLLHECIRQEEESRTAGNYTTQFRSLHAKMMLESWSIPISILNNLKIHR